MKTELRRKPVPPRILVGALLSLLWPGCVHVTEERAHRDETIGKRDSADMTFEVVDGLGAIRRFEPEVISIWAKAPSIEMKVVRRDRTPARFVLTVTNAMPDAVLETSADEGTPAPLPESLPSVLPTEKRWALTVSGGTSTLRVHSGRGEPTGPWRFALLSDIQEAIDEVQDIYGRMNADPSIAFVVSAGDLTTQGKNEQLERFQHELELLRVPFFPTLGNHELGTEGGAAFQRHFGRASFRFVYGGMQFTFLDSASATIDPLVYGWLDAWLAEGRPRTHAVLMHIPPIDPVGVRNGSFADRNEANKLLAKLAEASVDVTLYGHIHSYYPFSNAGIAAYISGGGGSIPERFDGIGRHYLTIDVDPVRGITQTGVVRIDRD